MTILQPIHRKNASPILYAEIEFGGLEWKEMILN